MAFDRSALAWNALNVIVNGKPATMKVANMSDAQIAAALKLASNKNAIAPGWNIAANGTVYKEQPKAPAPNKLPPADGVKQTTPSAPSTPATATATTAPKAATSSTPKFDRSAIKNAALNVTINGKPSTMLVKNMTDDQIIAALKRPDNANALAPGWVRTSSGQIIRQQGGGGSGVGSVGAGTPAPTAGGNGPAIGTIPTGTPPPVAGTSGNDYYNVRQKQADGTWKVVSIRADKLSPAQIAAAKASGLNGPVPGGTKPATTTTPTGAQPAGDTNPGALAGGGGQGAGATNPGNPGQVPSWIPPMVGLGGLNADPMTGKIDWSKLLKRAHEISAVDPEYAQDLSGNIWQAMQGVSPLQAEIQSLTTVDPSTGKTLYQSMFDSAMRKYNQDASKTFSTAAVRGIGSSGMVNSTLADASSQNQQTIAGYGKTYGNPRITELLRSMTEKLGEQDTNFTSSYYNALSRAKQRIPQIPGVG